jgi:hypothetical protein
MRDERSAGESEVGKARGASSVTGVETSVDVTGVSSESAGDRVVKRVVIWVFSSI